jgi:hypothetical protein
LVANQWSGGVRRALGASPLQSRVPAMPIKPKGSPQSWEVSTGDVAGAAALVSG